MKLAVSNIGWEQHDDPKLLKQLQNLNVKGIEIAPTKIWPDWQGACYKSAEAYKAQMSGFGLKLPAMQAILFGRPELQLFDVSCHHDFLEHFKLLSEIANGMGCKTLVFGAPKNRKRNQTAYLAATEIAAEFFTRAADICAANNCIIGLEHNPVEYGCDFITNALDAKQLVKQISHDNFKLHLDSGGLHMCGGDISEQIIQAGDFCHYHISEPMLEPIYGGIVEHSRAFKGLNECNYNGWVSIEMKLPTSNTLLLKSVEKISKIVIHS